MADKKDSLVPQEYVDKMQEYSIDEWRKKMIEAALKYQTERKTGADIPSWWEPMEDSKWHSQKYGAWNNCIATGTGAATKNQAVR